VEKFLHSFQLKYDESSAFQEMTIAAPFTPRNFIDIFPDEVCQAPSISCVLKRDRERMRLFYSRL